jgi:hypothetical protein
LSSSSSFAQNSPDQIWMAKNNNNNNNANTKPLSQQLSTTWFQLQRKTFLADGWSKKSSTASIGARAGERDVARERANESGIGGTHGGISIGVDRMGGTGGDLSGIWL